MPSGQTDYAEALQPIATSSAHARSTKILKDLAPQLLHPRILNSQAFINAGNSASSALGVSSSSSNTQSALSLSNPRNAFISLARLRNALPSTSAHSGSFAQGRRVVTAPSSRLPTSTDLRILEGVDRLLDLPIPLPTVPEESERKRIKGSEELDDSASSEPVNLLSGFNATIPSASLRKAARRKRRAGISERQLGISELGLKERGNKARGLLTDYEVESIESTPKKRVVRTKRKKSTAHGILNGSDTPTDDADVPLQTKPELDQELAEIQSDQTSLSIRRTLIHTDISELDKRIAALEAIKATLNEKLLNIREEELELEDELEGVKERLADLDQRNMGKKVGLTSSRRRKGPAFLPAEHDELPKGVAFMTLQQPSASSASSYHPSSYHDPYASQLGQSSAQVTALDFSEPYGLLVSAYSSTSASASYFPSNSPPTSDSDSGSAAVRIWDLSTGDIVGSLVGHKGIVKSLLVEQHLCITGGEDGVIALWDLDKALEEGLAEDKEIQGRKKSEVDRRYIMRDDDDDQDENVKASAEEDVFFASSAIRSSAPPAQSVVDEEDDDLTPPTSSSTMKMLSEPAEPSSSASRTKTLVGHSKSVTCLSFDQDTSLVSGSSDKTLRLWDLNTGQCVVTMDILWAISNPLPVEAEEGGEDNAGEAGGSQQASNPQGRPRASLPNFPSVNGSPSNMGDYGSPSASNAYPWHGPNSSYMTPSRRRSGLRRLSSQSYGMSDLLHSPTTPSATGFIPPTPAAYPDGSYEMQADFVGGVQLWSYALASGTADGCVRMWDTRTGQSVRSLIGHTSGVSCLQFDDYHLVSGSLDRSVRIWDLRTGRTISTLRYDGPVTDLQFDSRRIAVAAGSDYAKGVSIYNRTTLQQTELVMNGHTDKVEKLRFMDKYLASGARDGCVKIWSLQ